MIATLKTNAPYLAAGAVGAAGLAAPHIKYTAAIAAKIPFLKVASIALIAFAAIVIFAKLVKGAYSYFTNRTVEQKTKEKADASVEIGSQPPAVEPPASSSGPSAQTPIASATPPEASVGGASGSGAHKKSASAEIDPNAKDPQLLKRQEEQLKKENEAEAAAAAARATSRAPESISLTPEMQKTFGAEVLKAFPAAASTKDLIAIASPLSADGKQRLLAVLDLSKVVDGDLSKVKSLILNGDGHEVSLWTALVNSPLTQEDLASAGGSRNSTLTPTKSAPDATPDKLLIASRDKTGAGNPVTFFVEIASGQVVAQINGQKAHFLFGSEKNVAPAIARTFGPKPAVAAVDSAAAPAPAAAASK